ncbi:MAG: hypothetical protein JKY14_02870 [Paraglaciecola sp.]|nr:hypothetical protein [Paraglaciecola sp.]
MNTRFLITAVAIFMAPVVTTTLSNASAKTVCGAKVHNKYGVLRSRHGSSLATLRKDGSSHVVIYHRDKTAPLGWSHSLRAYLPDHESHWRVNLTTIQPMARKRSGFDVLIDDLPRQHFDKGEIENTNSVNEWVLFFANQNATSLVEKMKRGNIFVWGYETHTFQRVKIPFQLNGFTRAAKWAKCAQATLAGEPTDN